MKLVNRTAASICALGLGWTTLPAVSALAQSETNPLEFTPPTLPDRGRPSGRQRGGASRGDCRAAERPSSLTALVPATQVSLEQGPTVEPSLGQYESVLSLTTEPHPSFWFYVPYSLDEGTAMEFVFQDEDGNTLYQTQFVTEKESLGVVQVLLPETTPLAVDQAYQWYFMVHCDLASTSEPSYVNGWIVRTGADAALQSQLIETTALERASLYADRGIWQDALTTLGEHYRAHPQDETVQRSWASLLESVGLGDIAGEAVSDCCKTPRPELAVE